MSGRIIVTWTEETLTVAAPTNAAGDTVKAWSDSTLETEITFPLSVTETTTMYAHDGPVVLSIAQADGDVLYAGTVLVQPGTPCVVTPVAGTAQTRADVLEVKVVGGAAYVLPGTGIPETDLASAVSTSLGLADTAYQLPAGGITTDDLATGVTTSLGLADTATQPGDLGDSAALDVGTGAGTVCAGDDSRLLTATQKTQIEAAAVLCATVTACTVDDASITTAETSTFTCTPSPSFTTFSAVNPAGDVQLYLAGNVPLGASAPLVGGTVDIPVLGSVIGVGTKTVWAQFTPDAGEPWLESTSEGVEVTVSAA